MSVETSKKLKLFTGVKKKSSGLEQLFAELKENKKKPKYNYSSGLVAGMLIDKLLILQPILKANKKIDENLSKKILEQIIPLAKALVEDYNWNLEHLVDLQDQFFNH